MTNVDAETKRTSQDERWMDLNLLVFNSSSP